MINLLDILPALKVRGFWVQTTVAGAARLTLSRPTDNALPASTILSESRPMTGLYTHFSGNNRELF